MKICFLEIQPFPYTIGGGTTHLIDLSEDLIRKGHEISIISSKPGDGQKPLSINSNIKIYNIGIPHKIFKKTNIFYTIYSLGYRFIWELSWVYSAKKILKAINPEICNPQSLITTSLPCSLTKIPFVATQHGVYLSGFRDLWKERDSKAALILSKIYEKLEKFNSKRAKFITCVNERTKLFYEKFAKGKCKVIYHGIDHKNISNIDFSKKKDYLFMGRLTEQKGVPYLIDALKILDKDKIKITVNIVGNGDKEYVNRLKKNASKFRFVKVNFLGFIVGKDKFDLYAKSKIFITPSIFEPFGIVNVEAMASGCAMIAANHEGGKILVKKEYGEIVNFDEENLRSNNLAKAIKSSLKWDINKMGRMAMIASKKYNYDFLADKYIEIFKEAKIR